MKQLTMKLPEEIHRTLKMIAASTGKTMTELVIEWIEITKKKLFGSKKKHNDQILKILSSPVDDSIPRRWTKEELEEMCEDDQLTPEENAAIDASLKRRRASK